MALVRKYGHLVEDNLGAGLVYGANGGESAAGSPDDTNADEALIEGYYAGGADAGIAPAQTGYRMPNLSSEFQDVSKNMAGFGSYQWADGSWHSTPQEVKTCPTGMCQHAFDRQQEAEVAQSKSTYRLY